MSHHKCCWCGKFVSKEQVSNIHETSSGRWVIFCKKMTCQLAYIEASKKVC